MNNETNQINGKVNKMESSKEVKEKVSVSKCTLFDSFACLAANCPESCCKNWEMPVDEEALNRIYEQKGCKGFAVRLAVKKNKEKDPVLRTMLGRCIFWGTDRLCSLQKKNVEYVPKVCRLYPRRIIKYGNHIDQSMDLSCIKAAELFVNWAYRADSELFPNNEKKVFECDENLILWDYPQSDDAFRGMLLNICEKITTAILQTSYDCDEKLWRLERGLYSYVYLQHSRLVKGDIEGTFDLEPKDYISGQDELEAVIDGRSGPFFSIHILNELIYREFQDMYLFIYHRRVARIIQLFKKKFGKYSFEEADSVFLEKWNGLSGRYPLLNGFCAKYLCYLFRQTYLQASVDYYVLEPVLMALLAVGFLQLFLVIEDMEGTELSESMLTRLVSDCDHLLRHNESFRKAAMDRIREELYR